MMTARVLPVVLSGGSGSRLWPRSRATYPKQLLPLVDEHTLLQNTVRRAELIADNEQRPIVVANEAHRFLIAEQLREIDVAADLLLEPVGRNTAPALAIAALHAAATTGDDVVLLVLPADHVIPDGNAFQQAAGAAIGAAGRGSLVTFGVKPQHAETGYGYLEVDSVDPAGSPLVAFIEKPDVETAKAFVDGGRHFWNSGMFVFTARRYLDELGKFQPEMLRACSAAMANATADDDFIRPEGESFRTCPADSVDYAVMEHTDDAVMVPLDAAWSDVGSWSALHALADADADGNVTRGDALVEDCRNSYVSSESRLVTAVGVDDVVVVETKDAVLVTSMNRSQQVKAVVDRLQQDNREEADIHRQVFRPWGSYDGIDGADGFQVKRLIVNPGAVLSLQKHFRRAEHWVVVRGIARITLNDDVFDLAVNESTFIPIEAMHRIENPGSEPLHIIEVQCGDYLGEDDIVRFEDNYGREGTNT